MWSDCIDLKYSSSYVFTSLWSTEKTITDRRLGTCYTSPWIVATLVTHMRHLHTWLEIFSLHLFSANGNSSADLLKSWVSGNLKITTTLTWVLIWVAPSFKLRNTYKCILWLQKLVYRLPLYIPHQDTSKLWGTTAALVTSSGLRHLLFAGSWFHSFAVLMKKVRWWCWVDEWGIMCWWGWFLLEAAATKSIHLFEVHDEGVQWEL